eukprot:g4552.t1
MFTPSPSQPPSDSRNAALDHRVATPRPRRSWDTAFLEKAGSSNGGSGGSGGSGAAIGKAGCMLRPRPPSRTSISGAAAPAVVAAGGPAEVRRWSSPGAPVGRTTEGTRHDGEGTLTGVGVPRAGEGGTRSGDAAPCSRGCFPGCGSGGGGGGGGGDGVSSSFSRGKKRASAAPAAVANSAAATPSPNAGASPLLLASSSSSSSLSCSSPRAGGVTARDDDLTDTNEGVLVRLAEFTEIARSTAVQNEELSHELAAEKRRAAHISGKLEQSNITCTELRESLALAQDTVMKLREHEMSWAETTASEMSLRAELCALKDEHSSASAEASALRKRCEVLQRENAELGERFATLAEEKRQVHPNLASSAPPSAGAPSGPPPAPPVQTHVPALAPAPTAAPVAAPAAAPAPATRAPVARFSSHYRAPGAGGTNH